MAGLVRTDPIRRRRSGMRGDSALSFADSKTHRMSVLRGTRLEGASGSCNHLSYRARSGTVLFAVLLLRVIIGGRTSVDHV